MTQQAVSDQTSQDARAKLMALRSEIAKAVVGQDAVVSGLLIALLCRGHVLLEGVPGVAKTLLVRALAAALDTGVQAGAVHARPDARRRHRVSSSTTRAAAVFEFRQGPVFTNLLLADEINRTPPKTQAALLEAMEERQVTHRGPRRSRCPTRSSSPPRRTRSSTRAPTRCPRRSSTASCSS